MLLCSEEKIEPVAHFVEDGDVETDEKISSENVKNIEDDNFNVINDDETSQAETETSNLEETDYPEMSPTFQFQGQTAGSAQLGLFCFFSLFL